MLTNFQNRKLLCTAGLCLVLCSGRLLWAQTAPATLPNVGVATAADVLVITVQDDGKILIGGLFSTVNGLPRTNIARLNVDGSVDETWNPGLSATPSSLAV